MDKKFEDIETRQTAALLSAVVKIAVAVSFSVALVFWGYSCNISKETIQECKSACSSRDSQMSSVTNRECRCEKTPTSNWVIPRATQK